MFLFISLIFILSLSNSGKFNGSFPTPAIDIKEGSHIPNIRPYRYPHHQKEAIEVFVKDMLAAGLIRPSLSPYASPLILVKNKVGSWRFCMDYQA
jgi:hypothetical protein